MATVITLTTDFGTADGFVGAMKGVILSLAPHASIVDVTHDIPPHDIRAGTFALETALPNFPPNCFHVVVVDPGVGSERAAVLVATRAGAIRGPGQRCVDERGSPILPLPVSTSWTDPNTGGRT